MRALKNTIAISALALLLAGCGSTCAGWKSLNPSRKDVLTEGTKTQIVEHNSYGERQGCW